MEAKDTVVLHESRLVPVTVLGIPVLDPGIKLTEKSSKILKLNVLYEMRFQIPRDKIRYLDCPTAPLLKWLLI